MKILHVEDNARDAELFNGAMEARWPDCRIETVETAEGFLGALAETPDIILSDFSMPKFNGMEALRLARTKCPEVPFVFLSGTIGEERAIEALRSGAYDYVIKDRPQRLVSAIERAIHEAESARVLRAAEERTRRTERLENIGMLAAGIAHDFNNVLAPVLMAADLLKQRNPDPLGQKLCTTLESSATRGRELVAQIMAFVRGTSQVHRRVDLGVLVREVASMAEQTFPKNIVVKCEIVPGLRHVMADSIQLHQVLLNLCVNARDAMPEGGTLSLRTSQRRAATDPSSEPVDYLVTEVSDTGSGIPAEIARKIWDPFFTTKPEGKGTGLGLSTVRALVEAHGGRVDLHSEPGRGTTFEVWLPAANEDPLAASL